MNGKRNNHHFVGVALHLVRFGRPRSHRKLSSEPVLYLPMQICSLSVYRLGCFLQMFCMKVLTKVTGSDQRSASEFECLDTSVLDVPVKCLASSKRLAMRVLVQRVRTQTSASATTASLVCRDSGMRVVVLVGKEDRII